MKETVTIRPANQGDARRILDIYAPYILDTPVSFETDVPTLKEMKERIIKYQQILPWLVCEIDKLVVGYVYATNHRQRKAYDCTKELSVYVDPAYRKRGVATGLYTALIRILELQGVTSLLAGIALPNPESVAFHEKLGFRLVGIYHKVGFKLGRYHDAGWWELQTGVENPEPLKITPQEVLKNSDPWFEALREGISRIK